MKTTNTADVQSTEIDVRLYETVELIPMSFQYAPRAVYVFKDRNKVPANMRDRIAASCGYWSPSWRWQGKGYHLVVLGEAAPRVESILRAWGMPVEYAVYEAESQV